MNKLGFLTKYSLGKKIKSKWFIVVNIIILVVISALINMDSIIKLFGGDFNNNEEILVIDNIGVIDTFKNVYEINNKYFTVDENGNRISNEEFKLNYIVDFTEADFAQRLVDEINGEIYVIIRLSINLHFIKIKQKNKN